MTSPPGDCMGEEAGCPDAQKQDVLTNSLNAVGENFMRQFFTPQDLYYVDSNLSIILVISSVIFSYFLLKFTSYYITLMFLSIITLLHYTFGSRWCVQMMLARLTDVYTLLIMAAQYPTASAVFILGMISFSIWRSLRKYWQKRTIERRDVSDRMLMAERIRKIEENVNKVLANTNRLIELMPAQT